MFSLRIMYWQKEEMSKKMVHIGSVAPLVLELDLELDQSFLQTNEINRLLLLNISAGSIDKF